MKYVKLIIFCVGFGGFLLESCEFEEINFKEPIPIALPASGITSSGFWAAWSPVEGTENYDIQLATNDSFNDSSIVTGYPTTSNKTSLWISGLEADQTYYYRVKINGNSSRGGYSNVVAATMLPLEIPQVITPEDITPLSFVARWQSVPEAQGYLLYVSTNANFTEHLPDYNGTLVSDTTALVEGLTVDEDYFYRVRTVRGRSTSQTSDLMRASTSQLTKPVILDATAVSYTSITVNWEAVEGATSYKVYVGRDRFVITEVLPDYNPRIISDALSLVVIGLNASTPYYYRVQAINNQ